MRQQHQTPEQIRKRFRNWSILAFITFLVAGGIYWFITKDLTTALYVGVGCGSLCLYCGLSDRANRANPTDRSDRDSR